MPHKKLEDLESTELMNIFLDQVYYDTPKRRKLSITLKSAIISTISVIRILRAENTILKETLNEYHKNTE